MKDIIIKYFIIILWSILFYFLGILIKFLQYNIFESHLFITILSICCLFNSSYFTIFDKDHPKDIINNIFKLSYKNILYLYISTIPFYKILILCYIDTDPIIIQLICSNKIIINLIMTIIINKNIYLCNKFIIINICIQLIAVIIPLIFNDNFTLKISNLLSGYIGIILSCISLFLMSFINICNENIKDNTYLNFKDNAYTFIFLIYYISDIMFSLLFIPFTIIIEKYYKLNNNLINFNNITQILLYCFLISIIYAPIYNLSIKYYFLCNSIDIGITTNITFIITIILSYLLKVSFFYYLYIPSIIIIIITSLLIVNKINKLQNINNNMEITYV